MDQILDQFAAQPNATRLVSTSCLAAMLVEESLVRADAEQPRNHGAALKEFFTIRAGATSAGCSIDLQPRISSLRSHDDLKDLDTLEALSKAKAMARSRTGNRPGLWLQLAPRLAKTSKSRTPRRGASAGAGQAGINYRRNTAADFQGTEPEVVGFTRPIPPPGERRDQGARFGWLVSPRPGVNNAWTLPLMQAQLSAVVSLPSWWRSALLQVCTRFVPDRAIASVMDDDFWQYHQQCRVEMVRLPGSAADVSQRLGMVVVTSPYMEKWQSAPVLYSGDTANPRSSSSPVSASGATRS